MCVFKYHAFIYFLHPPPPWPGTDRTLLQRLSADFTHPFTCERPLRFPCHLIGSFGIANIITMSDINIHRAVFKLTRTRTRTWTRICKRTRTRAWTKTEARTQTWTRTQARTRTRTWNWNTFATHPNGAIVTIAPYGLLMTHHSVNSNSAINL
jgi:hypothetical protein